MILLLLGGCALIAPPSPAGEKFVVFFGAWSAAIDGAAAESIRAAADLAVRAPAAPVLVTGFADPQGSAAADVELSRSRAAAVRDLLVRDGVPPARIHEAAGGASADAFSAQQSRRVEIAVGRP